MTLPIDPRRSNSLSNSISNSRSNSLDQSPPDSLKPALQAAVQAQGNRSRFLQAGLITPAGELVADWRSAFARLKPLTKSELRSQPGAFLSPAALTRSVQALEVNQPPSLDIVYRGKTSGTQGDAFTYFAGRDWNRLRVQARERGLGWWGIDPATPMLNLASRLSPVRLQDRSLIGAIDGEFLDLLRDCLREQPLILRGYPSRLCELAIALHQASLPLPPVVAVIATGECLFESQRSLLQKTFQTPVINEYGSQESGMSGLSCPEAGRLHLDGDRCFYEIVNGELLTSDLHNFAMPMVRYSGGDLLRLGADPCPCGRPGPTAIVLGRQEEALDIQGNRRWPGEFSLPSFSGILGYQIQIYPDHRRLWVQPEAMDGSGSATEAESRSQLAPLKAWLTETLGEQATQVYLERPAAVLPVSLLSRIDSSTWLDQVTQQAWSSWLTNPLPLGEVQEIAALLQQLAAPRQMVLQGLSAQALTWVETLLSSEPARDPAVEAMKIRVLLWATGLMAGVDGERGVDAEKQYQALLDRFRCWREVTSLGGDRAPSLREQGTDATATFSALAFDLLAPLLTLETDVAELLWQPVRDLIQQCWPQQVKADPFTFHHYLALLDQAGWKAQRRPHPWLPALRPLPAMLLGDLSQFAARLDLAIVALWAEMVHNRPGRFVAPLPSASNGFLAVWQAQRQALLRPDRSAISQGLSRCFDQAQSPAEVAQCWLEQAYGDLVLEAHLDSTKWLAILREQVGLLGPSPELKLPSRRPANRPISNPMPWLPLLNALAPKLLEAGEPELAYACLFAAAPPNRHQSNFDRQTQTVNGKQSILSRRSQP